MCRTPVATDSLRKAVYPCKPEASAEHTDLQKEAECSAGSCPPSGGMVEMASKIQVDTSMVPMSVLSMSGLHGITGYAYPHEVSACMQVLVQQLQAMHAADASNKALVFTQFGESLTYTVNKLEAEGFKCRTISGKVRSWTLLNPSARNMLHPVYLPE